MKEILEEDVLRGCKTIATETRDGQTVDVNCRALSWAASCKVISLADPAETLLHTILNGVSPEQAKDEFLNQLTPMGMIEISNTVMTLTHGLSALKKSRAARNSAPPATPISTPPPASCAATDSMAAK